MPNEEATHDTIPGVFRQRRVLHRVIVAETPGSDGRSTRVELVLGGIDGGKSDLACLRFDGVHEFRLRERFCPPHDLDCLCVDDIAADQLEGIHYRVGDCEREVITFVSRTAEIVAEGSA